MEFFKFSKRTKVTEFFVDEHGFLLEQCYKWRPTDECFNGKGDAIGRSMGAYFVYEDPIFIEAIKKCWVGVVKDYDYHYKPQRHIDDRYTDDWFSRDHFIKTFVALKLANDSFFDELASRVKYRFNEGRKAKNHIFEHKSTPKLWMWLKSISGKKWATPLFYLFAIVEMSLTVIWNKLLLKILGLTSDDMTQEDFMKHRKSDEWGKTLTDRQRKYSEALFFPFALNNFAWQLFIMEDSFWKKLTQRICKPLIPSRNWVLMLLLDQHKGEFNKEDVINYKPMKGYNWSTFLNPITRRDIHLLTNKDLTKANVYDRDLLGKLWNYRNPDDKV